MNETLSEAAFWLAIVALVASVSVFARGVLAITDTLRIGGPAPDRVKPTGTRIGVMISEILAHRRFEGRPGVKVAHWFVMISFPVLIITLIGGFGQITDPGYVVPVLGRWVPWEWLTEIVAWGAFLGISGLMILRLVTRPRDRSDRRRFFGSDFAAAYFVEWTVWIVVACVLVLRGLEYAYTAQVPATAQYATALHYPLTSWYGSAWVSASHQAIGDIIVVVALIKIVVSLSWFVVVGLSPSMGVAWHRFLAIVNVFARRELDGGPALGPLEPMTVGGKVVDAEALEDLDEDARLGTGRIQDFTWKGLLDFSTCTECGRCQEQCPAWMTDKPLSPKLITLALRDEAYAAAPYVWAARTGQPIDGSVAGSMDEVAEAIEPPVEPDIPLVGGAIDPDALWACTMCGACVQECPVDIEHVDHIANLRRNQVLMESDFPKELGGMYRKLETKANPWGMAPRSRMDWAKPLDFTVPIMGVDVAPEEVDYLLWVGCAGAFEDRAKKTTRAIAELLHIAGVRFAVLGEAESCTGDPARRTGNELVFQMLAAANIETLNEIGVKRIVASCAHCFNTLAREYPQFGGSYEVLHHTQLLNQLVRDGDLRPVAGTQKVTLHDACFLGRHNEIYTAPRELAATAGELVEMPRNGERAMCCGGGGGRVWMEETIGTRINATRAREAVETGASTVATACPFCTQMLSDAGEPIAVTDVAQLLLTAVRRGESA